MHPLLLRIIAGAAGVLIFKELLSSKYSKKSNLHDQFLQFENKISVNKVKRQKLIRARIALQNRIKAYFKSKPGIPVPKFFIQGSYKMGTMILDQKGTYDVDLGIYFLTKPEIEPATLQKYIFESVNGHTTGGVQHREKCIRVVYKGDFDIDLPVYYKTENDKHPFLATKYGWIKSDPKQLCDWFDAIKDENGQLLRLVKYFKAWANYSSRKMPSGIALTVWVANSFKPNDRDDISFLETAIAIKESLFWGVHCKNPASPYDDFLHKLDESQKDHFIEDLTGLIKNGKMALRHDDPIYACNIWKEEFGSLFPSLNSF